MIIARVRALTHYNVFLSSDCRSVEMIIARFRALTLFILDFRVSLVNRRNGKA